MAQGKGNPEINKKVATSALVTLLVSVVGFYLGNRYWEAVASLGGQFFEHWGDGFALMWPLIADTPTHLDMSPNAMLAGLTAEDADAALQHILSTERMAVMYIQPDGTAPLAEDEEEAE